MLETGMIFFISTCYLGLLFAIAYFGDRHAEMGRSLISNPYIYALSLAVYCTAWTFYGSVGRAVRDGPMFLTIYIGPTLMICLGWLIMRKIIRISKVQRITSIADFIASRYGKSTALGGVVTIIAVLGVVPYISLQLKAVSISFLLIKQYPQISMPVHFTNIPVLSDTSFYIALMLAVFAILFGTRHLEATERHEGLVAAIAFESLVKLLAFLTVGIFVTYYIYDGFYDLFEKAHRVPQLKALFTNSEQTGTYTDWGIYIFLSMGAMVFLPRQFQIAVVENVNEEHLNKAMWLFPLYLLAINIFVLPVAFGGLLHFPEGQIDADTFVLTLPMAQHQEEIALLVYIGGISAATGMVIVETIALSTMICNDLVMPVLLRLPILGLSKSSDLSGLLLAIRRGAIVLILLMGYTYFRFIGEFYALVSIGLVSFAAVAQFGPAILGGIFWKQGSRSGALWGLIAGFTIWIYTLFLPSLVQAGILSADFVNHGPFGIELLKPFHLFGLKEFRQISHAVFWSLLVNVGFYIGVSLYSKQTAIEHTQAALFVDVFRHSNPADESFLWRGTASIPDLRTMLARFLGRQRADEALSEYAERRRISWDDAVTADADLVNYVEKLMASAIGSASARVMVSSVVKEEPLGIEEVMDILDETRQVIAYSRELERATSELKAANERLQELDRLKDEFISTVTHELKTPLTSVRSLAEILHDNPNLNKVQHRKFSRIIITESERLTRLISQVLDFQKIESDTIDWQSYPVGFKSIVDDAIATTQQLIGKRHIQIRLDMPDPDLSVHGDRDRLVQVMVNLLSNAVKFCDENEGIIDVRVKKEGTYVRVDVIDNGIGISRDNQRLIFDKFRQVKNVGKGRPNGTGLGLTITRRIIEYHNGEIWVESAPGKGAAFSFRIPLHKESG